MLLRDRETRPRPSSHDSSSLPKNIVIFVPCQLMLLRDRETRPRPSSHDGSSLPKNIIIFVPCQLMLLRDRETRPRLSSHDSSASTLQSETRQVASCLSAVQHVECNLLLLVTSTSHLLLHTNIFCSLLFVVVVRPGCDKDSLMRGHLCHKLNCE